LMKRINQDEYWIKYKTRLKEKGKKSERVFEDELRKNFFLCHFQVLVIS
jgi:hypothetical protein